MADFYINRVFNESRCYLRSRIAKWVIKHPESIRFCPFTECVWFEVPRNGAYIVSEKGAFFWSGVRPKLLRKLRDRLSRTFGWYINQGNVLDEMPIKALDTACIELLTLELSKTRKKRAKNV